MINAANAINALYYCIRVDEDPRIRRSANGEMLWLFHSDVAMIRQQLQRGQQLLCLFEELAPTHLEQLRAFDLGNLLLAELRQDKSSLLDAEVGTHHGVGVQRMLQEVLADADRPGNGCLGDDRTALGLHLSRVDQTGNAQHRSDVLAGPVGDRLSFPHEESFVVLEVFSDNCADLIEALGPFIE